MVNYYRIFTVSINYSCSSYIMFIRFLLQFVLHSFILEVKQLYHVQSISD